MKEDQTIKQSKFDDEIDLREIFKVLLRGKWIVISFTAFISIVVVIYSLSLPNIYKSEALLFPVEASDGISSSLRGYSSLAGLAGINLPSGTGKGNSTKALQKIVSLSFFENNILNNIYLPDLMAVKAWDVKTNIITFDENIYNPTTKSWVRNYSHPRKQIPSAQESFKVFTKKHLSLKEDKQSGFIKLSIKHQSPHIAKQWLELLVNEINNFFRQKDKSESEKSVSFLNMQISKTGLSELKEVLAQLMQEEIKKLTLIEAKEFYVFDYIDPPAIMEIKSEPKRSFICIVGALLGGLLGILYVLIRHYIFNEKT